MKLIGGDYAINPIGVSSILLFLVKPMGYLWFLYALFLMNILAYIVERTGINHLYVGIYAVCCFVCSAFFHSAWLGIFRVCRFGVFFAIGNGFANELVRSTDLKRRTLIISVIVFLLLEGFYLFRLQENGCLLQTFDEEPRYLFLWFVLAMLGGTFVSAFAEYAHGMSLRKTGFLTSEGIQLFCIYRIRLPFLCSGRF